MGEGVGVALETILWRGFNTLFSTRFRTCKLPHHPKQKPWRGGGLREINTPTAKSLRGQLLSISLTLAGVNLLTMGTASS